MWLPEQNRDFYLPGTKRDLIGPDAMESIVDPTKLAFWIRG